jgi:hypothetical protein
MVNTMKAPLACTFLLVVISSVSHVGGDEHAEDKDLLESSIVSFVTPMNGDVIRFTPFLVEIAIDGIFKVPEDGELQISMTYDGRGTQVRVLQSLSFMCWNVGDSEIEIKAQLITTRDVPVGTPAIIRVRQQPGPHFVVWSPSDGQIFVAHR